MRVLVRTLRLEPGQATVELVALLPLVAVVLALAWQLALAGYATWAAAAAARAAARAEALGAGARAAARDHLPPRLERGLRVRSRDEGGVEVSLVIPSVLGAVRVGRATAGAHFESQAAR